MRLHGTNLGGSEGLLTRFRFSTRLSSEVERSVPAPPAFALLDIGEVAVRLGATVRFVRRLVAERRIPYVKVGKFVRFDPAEVEQWIDDHRVGQLRLW